VASIGHIMVGMAAGRWFAAAQPAWRRASMACFGALSLLPDADVIGFAFGIRYGDDWGHRGATHSFVFAVALSLFVGLCARASSVPFWRTTLLSCLVLVSHPLLDVLTDGGRGCALLWPFDGTRHFAPWRPLPVAPIGVHFLSARGLRVALTELAWFAPLLLYALWPRRRPITARG
jgi:inner membrane protein